MEQVELLHREPTAIQTPPLKVALGQVRSLEFAVAATHTIERYRIKKWGGMID